MNTVEQSDSFQLKCGVRLPDSPFTPLIWMEGLRPLEPEGLFAQRNCLSAPFYGVVKAVWLHVLLNDVWIKACSYTQLGGAVQGIIERSTVKFSFYRSVFNVPKWGQKCVRAVGVDKEVFSQFCASLCVSRQAYLGVESAITFITKPVGGGAGGRGGGLSRGAQEKIIRDSMLSMTSSASGATSQTADQQEIGKHNQCSLTPSFRSSLCAFAQWTLRIN